MAKTAEQVAKDEPVAKDGPAKPQGPSFGMSEGTRDELERTGKATDPFTGRKLTRDDLPK